MVKYLSDGEPLDVQKVSDVDCALACTSWTEANWAPLTFTHQDDRVTIVGAAEIYNLPELAAQYQLPNQTVGAVVAACFRSGSSRWATQVHGNFALILMDRLTHQFTAVTDYFGIRPLYWYKQDHSYYLSSQIGAIRHVCDSLKIEHAAIYAYMHHQMIPSPYTIYENVHKLPPGFFLRGDVKRHDLVQYWDITNMPKFSGTENEVAKAIYERADDAVARITSDIAEDELACFLSGGTDTSTICGLLSHRTDASVSAYSVGFSEADYDEMFYARLAAKRFGLSHHNIVFKVRDVFELLPDIASAYDEPFGNSSALPALFCAQSAARDGFRYMLAGDGGDEIFAGNQRYSRQQLFRNYSKLPQVVRRFVLEPLFLKRCEKLPLRVFHKTGSYIRRARMPDVDRIYSYRCFTDEQLFSPDFLASCDFAVVQNVSERHFSALTEATPLDRHLYLDMKLTATDNDLRKVTRMCELAHIRVRYPLLDYPVVDLGFHIRSELKLKGTFGIRYIFKRAFRDLLPRKILSKRKQGFSVPVSTWLRTDPQMRQFARDLLFSKRHLQRGYFRAEFIKTLWDLHLKSKTDSYVSALWKLIMLETWHLVHAEGGTLCI